MGACGLARRRITLSTSGLVTRFTDVAKLGINLAVSLNATTNTQRDQLMPAANALHPLEELLTACRGYPLGSRRRLTFEYVLLEGVNDTMEDAQRLRKLLKGIHCKVNLIPFNAFPGSPYARPPNEEVILRFQAVLRQAGFDVSIFGKAEVVKSLVPCGQLGEIENLKGVSRMTLKDDKEGTPCMIKTNPALARKIPCDLQNMY